MVCVLLCFYDIYKGLNGSNNGLRPIMSYDIYKGLNRSNNGLCLIMSYYIYRY